MLDEVTISDSYGLNKPHSQSKMSSPDQHKNKLFYRSELRRTTAKMMSKMSSMEGKNITAESAATTKKKTPNFGNVKSDENLMKVLGFSGQTQKITE